MKIGIVGSEGAKFTPLGEERAKEAIRSLLSPGDTVVSGHCHLGGIDIWAEEVADEKGLTKLIFPPRDLTWSGGFKPRNLQIANNSDIVWCITVDSLPPTYKGMTFKGCYHCIKSNNGFKSPHIKSGGCWTALKCPRRDWIVIKNT